MILNYSTASFTDEEIPVEVVFTGHGYPAKFPEKNTGTSVMKVDYIFSRVKAELGLAETKKIFSCP
jgi:hypothetical protein